jgi:hypothetical protein
MASRLRAKADRQGHFAGKPQSVLTLCELRGSRFFFGGLHLQCVGHQGDALSAQSGGGAKMTRLIAAAMFVVAAAAPAVACELNQSAAAGSQSTTASQAQQSKPVHQHNRS